MWDVRVLELVFFRIVANGLPFWYGHIPTDSANLSAGPEVTGVPGPGSDNPACKEK